MFSFEKYPWEETTRAVDFTGLAEIQAGETINQTEIRVLLDDVEQPIMLVGTPTISENKVFFRVKDGIIGLSYKISVRIITNLEHRREISITMPIVEKKRAPFI